MARKKTQEQGDAPAPMPAGLSFEEALAELENIVRQLEQGNESLADGVALYERGVILKTHCESLLRDAQMKVERIELRDGKAVGTLAADEADGDDGAGETGASLGVRTANRRDSSDDDADVPF